MARTSVLTALGSLLLVAHNASAVVHRVKLAKRSDEEFLQAKLARIGQNMQDHPHEDSAAAAAADKRG